MSQRISHTLRKCVFLIAILPGVIFEQSFAETDFRFEVRTPFDTYPANAPILLEFNLIYSGTEERPYRIPSAFFLGHEGIFLQVADMDRGEFQPCYHGWHGDEPYDMELMRKSFDQAPKIRGGVQFIWESYLPPDEFEVYRQGLNEGAYLIRAKFLYPHYHIDLLSEPIEVTVIEPGSQDEKDFREKIKMTNVLSDVIVGSFSGIPTSEYIPHFLNYLAWYAEKMSVNPGTDPEHKVVLNALEFRERLRREYPDWPYQDQGYFREAAVRFKRGETDESVRLLETLMDKYPHSKYSAEAKNLIPQIYAVVARAAKEDYQYCTTEEARKHTFYLYFRDEVRMFNLEGPFIIRAQ